MKKFTILLALLAFIMPAFAQGDAEPNRLILTNSIGNRTGYVLDRVDSITFAKVDGEVKANVELFEATCDMLRLAVTKTKDCYSYNIGILPENTAKQYDDLTVITYLDRSNPPVFYDDYTNAELTGIELEPGTDYVLVTVGIDGYGIKDGVVRVPFSTPKPEILGNPEVEAEVVDRTLDSFSIKFTPNDDVLSYYCVAGEKGQMQSQFEMFGPWMGLTSMTDLIMSWGAERQGENVVKWTSMAPNTDFEVYYVALDLNGNPADYKVIEVSTLALGGEGQAMVDIELLEYEYSDWDGEMKPSQFIGFTPNDQASCYRFGVYFAKDYDKDPEAYNNELRTDPPMPAAYWFFYEPLVTDFQIDPNTEAVAIAAAKNTNGEWGEVTVVRFTTPAEADGKPESAYIPAASSDVKARFNVKKSNSLLNHEPGKLPVVRKAAKIQLK